MRSAKEPGIVRMASRSAPLFRVVLLPGTRTGLRQASQAMIDKIVSVPRDAIAQEIGEIDSDSLTRVDDSLRRWLGVE